MKPQTDYLEDIKEIRSIMERSSKFISLNTVSGVFVGIIALIGAAAAYFYSHGYLEIDNLQFNLSNTSIHSLPQLVAFYVVDAVCILTASILVSMWLTIRKARKNSLPIWDITSKRLFINMMIPLSVGGIFCLILIYHELYVLLAPSTLLFYGLALFNSSKYTMKGIKYLGIAEILLGLTSAFFLGLGFFFWVLGFGIVHIVYGIINYFLYEQKSVLK